MSVFVDTGVWYAHHDRDASRHESATAAFDSLLSGRHGRLFTSDHVLDEAVTLMRSRTGRHGDSRRIADRILGTDDYPGATELLLVDEAGLEASLDVFDRYRDHSLSFTDATTIALMDEHGVEYLLSFDDDFDGIVERLDPASFPRCAD